MVAYLVRSVVHNVGEVTVYNITYLDRLSDGSIVAFELTLVNIFDVGEVLKQDLFH